MNHTENQTAGLSDFERSIQVRQVGESHPTASSASTAKNTSEKDTTIFTPIRPPWTWPANPGVVPGGLLMSLCANAAWKTLPDSSASSSQSDTLKPEWTISSMTCNFLSGMDARTECVHGIGKNGSKRQGTKKLIKPIHYHVTTPSRGRRFQSRLVLAVQAGRNIVSATVNFVSLTQGGMVVNGPRMTHSIKPHCTGETPNTISIDDLKFGRGAYGPFMEFQRLPLIDKTSGRPLTETQLRLSQRRPENTIAPTLARIFTPLSSSPISHILALLNLSDYHVLDAPLALHGVLYGYPPIGKDWDWKNMTRKDTNFHTSLNHSVQFHAPDLAAQKDGWRADEVIYIEVASAWARNGRASLESRVFSTREEVKDGKKIRVPSILIATCLQEAFYVLKDDAVLSSVDSKL